AVPPHASSGALRFSLAVGESSTAVRMGLERQLIAYTEERGFGLWLADSRMGYRTGNWFHVRGYDADRVREHEEANDPDSRPVTICLPVTFVGPARVGSTNALLKLLRSLPFVGIIGTSNTTLDDLAFIHMQLSVRGLTTGDLVKANRRLADGVRSHHGGPLDVLGDVFRALDRREEFEANTRNGPELVLRAYDYKTLVRNVFPCIPPPGRRRMAIWFSWQIECEDSGLVNVMKGLYEAFQMTALIDMKTRAWTSREESPNIEYLICRRVDYSLLRGKGKISIPKDVIDKRFKDNDLERPASRFSMNLEAAWKTKLASIGGFRELTVAWREAWLGHWEPASY
ncbi:MAG TPA: hypothetical protein VJX10_02520, partial [Pseudonocardiaceae bacterium]|nr:hypothetical protein [Pseudonocardiaceae bacterium]